MIAFMLAALLTSAIVSLAAFAADAACREIGAPRRWTWALALVASVALPSVAIIAESLGAVPSKLPAAVVTPVVQVIQHAQAPASIDTIIGGLWILASLIIGLSLLITHRRLARVQRSAFLTVEGVPVEISEAVGPAVIGLARPRVVLPLWALSRPSHERELIVAHELEHVRQRDAWLLVLSAALLVMMPWNALLWWQQRRLRYAVEIDCDARVLGNGDPRAYGLMLLHMTARGNELPLAVPFLLGTRRLLERRIRAMTAPRPARRALRWVSLSALAVGFTTVGAFTALAGVSAAEASPVGQSFRGFVSVNRSSPRETVIIAPGKAGNNRRPSPVVIDGKPSTYDELRSHRGRRIATVRMRDGVLIATTR